ncbi:hypothetical protein C1645_830132, partial [Glomus cerebriforme]
YDKALSDLDKVIQLDPLNNLAYYYKSLIYHAKQDVDNTSIAYNKFTELVSDDILTKIQLYHLEYLLNNNSLEDLSHILAKINQISNIKNYKSLLLIRCKIYIELKKYNEAKLDFVMLSNNYYKDTKDILFIHLLREYPDFWSYLYKFYQLNNKFTELGIINEFYKLMYQEMKIYFISNLINLNKKLCYFQESDANSLSGQVLCSKNEEFRLDLPVLYSIYYNIMWKINVKKILSKDCFIKFIVFKDKEKSTDQEEHILKYEDVSKLEGLGWIEYNLPINLRNCLIQQSIEVKGSIDMQIDYVRFGYRCVDEKIKCIPNVDYLLPDYLEICPNIPETFKDKYFSKKEMENLLELKDIINNL